MTGVKKFSKEILDYAKQTIGYGAYGIVYKIIHEIYGTIAVKTYHYTLDVESDRREIDNLVNLNHNDYMVRFLGALVDESGSYVGHVTAFMDGGSLHTVIYKGPDYQLNQAFSWMEQAAYGLSYLHSEGIVHRDVKPLNMLLSDNHKNLKICDLGLSRPLADISSTPGGTYVYMSPEAIVYPKTVSFSTDVWSLAISMLETLKRRCPYGNMNNCEIIISAAKQELQPGLGSNSDDDVGKMMTRMLQQNPEDRPKMLEIREFLTEKKDTCPDKTILSPWEGITRFRMEEPGPMTIEEPYNPATIVSNAVAVQETLPTDIPLPDQNPGVVQPHRLYWSDGNGKMKDLYENTEKAINDIDTRPAEKAVQKALSQTNEVFKDIAAKTSKEAKPLLRKFRKNFF